MNATVVVLLLGAIPLVAAFVFLGMHQKRREAKAMRDFADLLRGRVVPGTRSRGPRATGHWNGREVSVGFFGRTDPPVFLTCVTASRRFAPFAALMVPRGQGSTLRREPPADAPDWITKLDRTFDAGGAPAELLRVFMDESTARSLTKLDQTEVEVLPKSVNVQRREVLYSAPELVPLLDAAVQLLDRLDALEDDLLGSTEEERSRRAAEVTKFLNRFRAPR